MKTFNLGCGIVTVEKRNQLVTPISSVWFFIMIKVSFTDNIKQEKTVLSNVQFEGESERDNLYNEFNETMALGSFQGAALMSELGVTVQTSEYL